MPQPPESQCKDPDRTVPTGPVTIDSRRVARLRSLHPGPLREDNPLLRSGQVLGRDGGQVDLIQAGTDVSRRHAWIGVGMDEHWEIGDLDSLNGTFVNGQAVEGRRRLQSGDVIGLGGARAPDYEFALTGAADRRTIFLVGSGPWTVGRGLHLDLPIPADLSVSEQHARIERDGDQLRVLDLGSRNGLWQGESRSRQLVLTVGDQFILGHHRIQWLEASSNSLTLELSSLGQAIGLALPGWSLIDHDGQAVEGVELAPGQLHRLKIARPSARRALMASLGPDRLVDGAMFSQAWLAEQPARQRDRVGLVDRTESLPAGLRLGRWLSDEALLRLGSEVDATDRSAVIQTTVEALGLHEHFETRLQDLGASARIRARLAAALLTRPGLLVLDTSNLQLDPAPSVDLLDRLNGLAGASITVVILSPDQGIELAPAAREIAPVAPSARHLRRPTIGVIRCLMSRGWSSLVQRPANLAILLLLPVLLVLALTRWLNVQSAVVAAQTVLLISTPLAALALTGARDGVPRPQLHRFGLLPDQAVAQALFAAATVTVQFVLVLGMTTALLPLDVWSLNAGMQVLLAAAAGMSLGFMTRSASQGSAQLALVMTTLVGTFQAVWIFKIQLGFSTLLGLTLLWTASTLLLGARRRPD